MWRYRVPTVRKIEKPDSMDDAETLSLAKFADADEDALQVDRPHAPHCVHLTKFQRKESTEERYADLSFSTDDHHHHGESIRTSLPRGEDGTEDVRRSGSLLKLLKECRNPHSSALLTDDSYDLDVHNVSIRSENFRYSQEQGGLGTRRKDRNEERGLVRKKASNSHRPSFTCGDEVVPNTCTAPKPCPPSTSRHEVMDARVIPRDNLFVRAYNFIRLMLAALCQALKNSLKVLFQVWCIDRTEIPRVGERSDDLRESRTVANIEKFPCSTKCLNGRHSGESQFDFPKSVQKEHFLELRKSKSSELLADETHFDVTTTVDAGNFLVSKETTSIEKHLDEMYFDLTTTGEVGNVLGRKESKSGEVHSRLTSNIMLGNGIKPKESNSSSGSRTMRSGTAVETGMVSERKTDHSTRTSSKAVSIDVRDAEQMSFEKAERYFSDKKVVYPRVKKKELAVLLNTSMLNRDTKSVETPTEEKDGDAWLWDKIESSDKWMDESEGILNQATPMEVAVSPLKSETPVDLQSGTRNIRMDSSNECSFYSPEPEARKMVEKRRSRSFVVDTMDKKESHLFLDGENLLTGQRPIRRTASSKSPEMPVRLIELQHRRSVEEQRRMPLARRTTSANYEPELLEGDDISNTQSCQQCDQDQYISSPPHTPGGASEAPKRKASIRSGIKNDVKAVTESVRRALLRNKPEPDTRFTSPRSAQKTLTIIADVMVKELECMVAVRRTGAFKIRSEKVYSADARLRITLRFRALDAFSCSVIICRSRDDDFTVPTADYVNFVAALQQKFLNSVTGAWRYQ